MNDITVSADIQQLLEQWAEAERNGVRFPVPFDMAFPMAGYSTKASAKRAIKDLMKGEDFSTQMLKSGRAVRSSELITFSLDGFKEFCLLARTAEGRAIRQYFIEAEKKWKLVQQIAPNFAGEIEVIRYQQQLEEKKKATLDTELELLRFRDYITKALPEPVQQKVLGFKEVKTVEYRDRVLDGETLIRDGSTLNKTALCHRYGLLSKTGSPNYKQLDRVLKQLPSEAFKLTAIVRENEELNIDYLPDLDRLFLGNTRQLGLGE